MSLSRTTFILLASVATVLAQAPSAPVAPAAAAPAKSAVPATATTLAVPAAEIAKSFKPTPAGIDLKDGDTFVFLGDSITHQCLYTQYVEDYFYTRYPKTRIHFHNAGVGGDRAKNALDRFDEDVASYKPKYVSILLGMNDGSYTRFEQPIFDTYEKDMTTLLDRIAGIKAAAIPMTPTMFDSRASKLTPKTNPVKESYYNGVLSFYGSWLREQAYDRGLGFVDMWAPLNDLTLEQRKKDPKWTMIADAVHPGPVGQTVMAVAILENMVPRTPVAQLVVDQVNGKANAQATRGAVANLKNEGGAISFDFTAESLPWVLPADAKEGFKLTHAGHRYGNEKITVRSLPVGKYDVKIDGQSIGTFTSGQLAFGVEIEENDKTPQYQQALKVALLNKQRNDEAMRPLRDMFGQLKGRRNQVAAAENNKAADLAEKKAAFEAWYGGEFKTKVEALKVKAREFEDQIYKINQPVSHHFEIALAK